MTTSALETASHGLPVTGKITLAYSLSLLVVLLMIIVSIAGIFYPSTIYPTDELLQTFLANDIVNLVIGVPILLISMEWARRGKLVGLLFWPGALFYVLYNYMVYLLAMPVSIVFLAYAAVVALSIYTLIGLVGATDAHTVKRQLAGAVPERLAGGVLVGLGTIFVLRVIGVIASALANSSVISSSEAALLTTDFLINPAWIIGGVLLWRREAFGYVAGLGLLFQGSMLFIGLIAFLILQPILTDAPFALIDVIVTFALGLICFIPFGLFVRGTVAP